MNLDDEEMFEELELDVPVSVGKYNRIYMETTSVPYRSKSFDEKTEQLSTALSSPNRANPL